MNTDEGMQFREFFAGKKVLIAGGLGFIGSNLSIKLVGLGSDVTIIDSLDPNCGGNEFNIEPVKNKVNLLKGDLRNTSAIIPHVSNKEIIFNLTGHLSHKRSMEDPLLDFSLNAASSLSLLQACKQANAKTRIIHAGTRGQYGKIEYNPVDEKHPNNFTDINGISKQAAENFHFLYSKLYPQIQAVSLRLTNCYGPRHQMLDPSQGFIGWFIRKALDNDTIEIWGGDQTRDFNFVDDLVEALLLVAMKDNCNGEIFNMGSGKDISLKELSQQIVEISGSGKLKVIPMPEEHKKIEIGDYKADISKIFSFTGWKPKTELKEGLKKTIDYYKKNKEKYW